MRKLLVMLASTALLSGCSIEIPDFLGREGGGGGSYSIDNQPHPDPRPVPFRSAELEKALHGVIVRVAGEAPAQGYWGAALRPVNGGQPDAAGVMSFEFVAVPPASVTSIGPSRTRELMAAIFVPNLALKDISGFRVSGVGSARTLPLR